MMPHSLCVKSRRTALHGHFAHQAGLHQVAQIVIDRGSGGARIDSVYSFEDFRGRRVAGLFHQERHYCVALRGAAQAPAGERALDRMSVHVRFVGGHF